MQVGCQPGYEASNTSLSDLVRLTLLRRLVWNFRV